MCIFSGNCYMACRVINDCKAASWMESRVNKSTRCELTEGATLELTQGDIITDRRFKTFFKEECKQLSH